MADNGHVENKSISKWILAGVAIVLLAIIFYVPIWWVSLTAPNYPPESFPDGVRINFHVNGVFNGCRRAGRREIKEKEALDCVHEMDTINHYVGMYPIAAGAPIERAFSQFLLPFLGVMIVAFVIRRRNVRIAIMAVGFGIIAVWMYVTVYTPDGVVHENTGYLKSLVSSLEEGIGDEGADTNPSATGQNVIERLKQSLAEDQHQARQQKQRSVKQRLVKVLHDSYMADHFKTGVGKSWIGSGYQVMSWHYGKTLARYFNEPREIRPMVHKLRIAINIVFWGLIAAMILLVVGAAMGRGVLYWLEIIVPAGLPLFFVIDYSAWLWWFGHNLNRMGAFTVKPFMPTVFGDGKVAQFTTHSYPYYGFGLMVLFAVVVAVIALIRRKEA